MSFGGEPFSKGVKVKTMETALATMGEKPPHQPLANTQGRETAAGAGGGNPKPPNVRANWSFRYPDCSSPGRYVTEKLAVDERGEFFTVSTIKETDPDSGNVLKFGHTTILKDDIRTVRFETRYGDPSWDGLGMITKMRVYIAIIAEALVIMLTKFTRCSWRCCCHRRDVSVRGTTVVQYVPVFFVLGPAIKNAAKGMGGGMPKLFGIIGALMNPLTWMQIVGAFMVWQLWWAFPRFDYDKEHYDMEQKMDQSRLAIAMLLAIFEVLVMFPITCWWMGMPMPCNCLENRGCLKRCDKENLRKVGGIEDSGAMPWVHRVLVLCFGVWMMVVIALLPWAADWNQVCLNYREYACMYPREWAKLYPSLDAPADYELHPALVYDYCNPSDEVVQISTPVISGICGASDCGVGEVLILPALTCNSTACTEDDDCCEAAGQCLDSVCNTTAWFSKPSAEVPEYCSGALCSPEECCIPAGSCGANNTCAEGYVSLLHQEEYCAGTECSRQECCEPVDVCKEVDCIAGALILETVDSARLKPGAAGRACSSRSCTVSECCDLMYASTTSTTSISTTSTTSTTTTTTVTTTTVATLPGAPTPAPTTSTTTTTTTTTLGPAFCSDAVCGFGYNLKPGVMGRSCNGENRCTVAECCDEAGLCATFDCSAESAVPKSQTEPCASTQCTAAECCGPADFCTASTCAGEQYVLKFPAALPPSCETDECTIAECCDVRDICTHSDCGQSLGFVLMAEELLPAFCGADEDNFRHCTRAECCTSVGSCDGFTCTNATIMKETPDLCMGLMCENSECCEARGTCARHSCTSPEVLLENPSEFCGSSSCSDAECCGTPGVCEDSDCFGPFVLMQAPPEECESDVCSRDECCVQACSELNCGTGLIFRGNESEIGCASQQCTRAMDLETCCQAADICQPSDCFLPAGMTFNVPEGIRGITSPIVLKRDMSDFCPGADCTASDCCSGVSFCNFDGVLQPDGTLTESSSNHSTWTQTICGSEEGMRPSYRPYPEQPPVPCVRDECLVQECCVPSREGEVLGDECCAAIGDEVCGVGGCRCDPFNELSCHAPPACGEREVTEAEASLSSAASQNVSNFDADKTICVSQPMCAVGLASETNASGMNWPILIVTMCTSIGLFFLFLSWLLLTINICLARVRSNEENVTIMDEPSSPKSRAAHDEQPMPTSKARVKVNYQRFVVVFAPWPWACQCRRRERNCIFRLGADVVPERVADELLLRRPLAIAAKRFPGYNLPGERSASGPLASVAASRMSPAQQQAPLRAPATGTPKALPAVSLDKQKTPQSESQKDLGLDYDEC